MGPAPRNQSEFVIGSVAEIREGSRLNGQRKKYHEGEIINILRQAEVLISQGQNTLQACRQLGISEPHSVLSYRPPAP